MQVYSKVSFRIQNIDLDKSFCSMYECDFLYSNVAVHIFTTGSLNRGQSIDLVEHFILFTHVCHYQYRLHVIQVNQSALNPERTLSNTVAVHSRINTVAWLKPDISLTPVSVIPKWGEK